VANFGGAGFQLYLTSAEDFLLTKATPEAVSACEVAWRGDGAALVLGASNSKCEEGLGNVAVLEPATLTQTPIATGGAHPAWRPELAGG
jgi:hypothetical protein